jgi:hypothetical protein
MTAFTADSATESPEAENPFPDLPAICEQDVSPFAPRRVRPSSRLGVETFRGGG